MRYVIEGCVVRTRIELKIGDLERNVHRKISDEVIEARREYQIKDEEVLRKDGTRSDIIVRFRTNLTSDLCPQFRRILPAS
jgi:hypothetical protein